MSQIKTEFELETASGYAYNIFRSPSSFFDGDEVLNEDELYRSSFYQDISFKGMFTKSWENQSLSLRVNPRGRLFYSDSDATYYTIYSRLRYENEISNKTKLQVTSHYNYRDREGENLDDNELRTPLGYRHYDISAGLFFRLYRQNRSFLKVEYGNRNYQDGETNDLKYDYYSVQTVLRNVFKKPAGWHSYGIEVEYEKRLFDRTYYEDPTLNETRDWSYLTLEPFYRWPITNKWRLRGGLEWSKRTDNDNGTFTYNQLRPSLELRYKTESFMVEAVGSYANRDYEQLNATNTNGEVLGKLNLKYYRLRANMDKKIGKNLYLTATAYTTNRVSNRTNGTTTAFRSYDYFYGGIGLKYRF